MSVLLVSCTIEYDLDCFRIMLLTASILGYLTGIEALSPTLKKTPAPLE